MINKTKIAIHGVPRSGTSWVGSIFDSNSCVAYRHQPLFSYAFKGRLTPMSTAREINEFYAELLETTDDFVTQKEAKNVGSIPVFKKQKISTIVYKEARYHNIVHNLLTTDKDLITVGIIRNPKSVINSWLKAPKEFDTSWDWEEEWFDGKSKNQSRPEEFYGFKKWMEVAELFLKLQNAFPKRFYLLKYQELLDNPISEVRKLFSFCRLDVEEQTESFLLNSSNTDRSTDAYSVYRANQVDDRWKSELPLTIVSEIDNRLLGGELGQFC